MRYGGEKVVALEFLEMEEGEEKKNGFLGFVLTIYKVGLSGLEWDPTQLTRMGWLMGS